MREKIRQAVETYYKLELQEKEIKTLKQQAAQVILDYFRKLREKRPHCYSFTCDGYMVRLQEPTVDDFDAEGLYKAVGEALPSLFLRVVNKPILYRLLDEGKLDRVLVSRYYRPIKRRPYIRVYLRKEA